ncbi:hypothetical protein J4435_00745 [Candidatus Woesearchaeota archaeon]|nr:hypothetical protein [Candidatus Woesearchaeota archaeon]
MDNGHSIERKLSLLKESLDAGIIDREEYESNKSRLEQQLKRQAEQKKEGSKRESKQESKGEVKGEEPTAQPEPAPKHHALGQEEVPGKKPKEKERKERPQQGEPAQEPEPAQDKKEEQPSPAGKQPPEKEKQEEREEEKSSTPPHILKEEHPPRKNKRLIAIILWVVGALLLLGMLVFFSITLEKATNETLDAQKQEAQAPQMPQIACSTVADCAVPGNESRCLNPGTPESSCERQGIVPINVTVINDKGCTACGTSRVIALLGEWFPGILITGVDASSPEGKALIAARNVTMLPAYVLGPSLRGSLMFQDVNAAFRPSGTSYVMKDSASGAVLYLGRAEQLRKLDVFLAPEEESSRKALLNMEEFASLFSDELVIRVHIVRGTNASEQAACVLSSYPLKAIPYLSCTATDGEDCFASNGISAGIIASCLGRGEGQRIIGQDASLWSSLALPMPSFLLNNNVKITGVQAADSLKEQYCARNPSALCSRELRKSLA